MRIVDNRWQLNSRDIWHGVKCFKHCLPLSMAVAAGLESVQHVVEDHVANPGAELRMVQGKEYEERIYADLKKNLGDEFHLIPELVGVEETKSVAGMGKIVMAQAQLKLEFDEFDYNSTADLLVRSDHTLEYLADGSLSAVPVAGASNDGLYTVWEVKHSSLFDNKTGKRKEIDNYLYQLAMNYESLKSIGLASDREAGFVFKYAVLDTHEPKEILTSVQGVRAKMFAHLEDKVPFLKSGLEVTELACDTKSICDNARCDYPDICLAELTARDDISLLTDVHHLNAPKLKENGFDTVTKVATLDLSPSGVKNQDQLAKHQLNAQCILEARENGKPVYKVVSPVRGGKKALPPKTEQDLYIDFEWFQRVNSRDDWFYLFGLVNTKGELNQIEAVGEKSEEQAFGEFIEQIEAAIALNPEMHVYYTSKSKTEVTKTRDLRKRFEFDETRVDAILTHFVDLQGIASESLITSVKGFGLKAMEVFFNPEARDKKAMPADGDASQWDFYQYLKLLEAGKTDEAEATFSRIKRYHEIDCQSVKKFYDWLATLE
jgi:predicted RecB family nuclease